MPSRRRGRKFLFGATGFLFLATLATGPAQAAPAGDTAPTSPEAFHAAGTGGELKFSGTESAPAKAGDQNKGITTMAGRNYTITCVPDAQNPHPSTGAGRRGQFYFIYKTRVSCTGTGEYPPTATIRVRGGLMYDKANYKGDTSDGIKWQTLSSSDETRTVKVDGSANTFYTPKSGVGGTLTGHYQGSSTVEITSPTGFKIGSDISYVGFCYFKSDGKGACDY